VTAGYRILGSLLPEFLEFIEARGALADMSQQFDRLSEGREPCECEERLGSRAIDALGIQIVQVYDPIKSAKQLFFGDHPIFVARCRIPRSPNAVDENRPGICFVFAWRGTSTSVRKVCQV
jgi:hypothetical protein